MWEQLSFDDQEWGLDDKFVLFPVWEQTHDASKAFSSWSNCSWQRRFISWACARYDKSSCFFSSSILDFTLEIWDSRSVYIETHVASQPYTLQTLFGTRHTFWSSFELHFANTKTLKLSRPRAIKFVAGVFTSAVERNISMSSPTPLSMLISF